MKQSVCLLLAFLLCISLCACGSRSEEPTTLDPAAQLERDINDAVVNNNAFWSCANRQIFTAFLQDGTTASPDGLWDLKGTTLTRTLADGTTDILEVRQIGGQFLITDKLHTFYTDDTDWDKIPQSTVQITAENWSEYFEIQSVPVDDADMQILKLKDGYFRAMRLSKSQVTLRGTVNGNEMTVELVEGTDDDCYGIICWGAFLSGDAEEVTFEVTEASGTLCLIDGI